jgi:ribosomal protein L37E
MAKLKVGDKRKDTCRKCGKVVYVTVTDVTFGIPCYREMPDCGGHKEEFEKVKQDYNCYVDFLYGKKKKVKEEMATCNVCGKESTVYGKKFQGLYVCQDCA